MNKRILSVLLVALMAVGLVVGAVTVSAADGRVDVPVDDEHTSLAQAAKDGGYYYLTDVFKLGADVHFERNTTLDINGYYIDTHDIVVDSYVTVSIDNKYGARNPACDTYYAAGKEWQNAEILGAVVEQNGKLVINNVVVYKINNKGTLELTNVPQVKALDKDGNKITAPITEITNTGTVTVDGNSQIKSIAGGTVYVKSGYVNTISGASKVVVSGGKVENITGCTTVEVTGGEVVNMTGVTYAEQTGGKIDNVKANVRLKMTKGEIVTIDNDKTIYVEVSQSSDKSGHVDKDGKDVTVEQARITGKIGKDANVTIYAGIVTDTADNTTGRVLLCAGKYTAVALYHDVYVTEKKYVKVATDYVFGEKLIEAQKLDSVESYKSAEDNRTYAGSDWVVVYANKHCDLDFTAIGHYNWVMIDEDYSYTDDSSLVNQDDIQVNGLTFGTNLQPCAVISHRWLLNYFTMDPWTHTGDDDWTDYFFANKAALLPGSQPVHKWATELTKKTEAGKIPCGQQRVLQDYFADTLNFDYFAKPDANGKIERQYDQSVEKDGPIFATGHVLTYHPYVAAAEGKDGNDAYYTCDNCGKFFAKDVEVLKGDYGVQASAGYEIPGVPTIKADPKETKAPETTAAPAETTKAPETTAAPAETGTTVKPVETGDNGMSGLVWVIVLGAAITGVAVAGKSVLASKKH